MTVELQPVSLLAGFPDPWAMPLSERLQHAGRKPVRVVDQSTSQTVAEGIPCASDWSDCVDALSRLKDLGQVAETAIIAAVAKPRANSLNEALPALETAVATNTQAPLRLINALLAEMLLRKSGKILLVTWHHAALPQPEFAAARSTARSISIYAESLRPALNRRGINLSGLLLAPRDFERWDWPAAAEKVCAAITDCLENPPRERRLVV